MAEHGEWNLKGASLTEETACTEYRVAKEFIRDGIRDSKLEFRETSMWGNPVFKLLRSQVEGLIIERLGHDYLVEIKAQTELRRINSEMNGLKRKLTALEKRKAEIRLSLKD